MEYGSYYVYALKDPRTSPAKPFYIGKGTGMRAWDHDIAVDGMRKGKRIEAIQSDGHQVIISVLTDNLHETQALKLEAEIISAFGTEDAGGLLTNAVVPTGVMKKIPKNLIIPLGIREKAQLGLEMIMELAQANKKGITNADAAKSLGLQSDFQGGSKDYMSFSVIGLLMREGRLKREKDSSRYCPQVR